MFNPGQSAPGEWFTCLNVGDDKITGREDRRKDKDLIIPGYSLVEIVGIRTLGATDKSGSAGDHLVFEVRLPIGIAAPGEPEELDEDDKVIKYVELNKNLAFTGPSSIGKLKQGRIKFAPTFCRYEGDLSDNEKIFGRYTRPAESTLSGDELDRLDALYGGGVYQQLLGDPAGHLKLPPDLNKASKYQLQAGLLGWNVQGIYKYTTGIKKEDDDTTKNLLVFVAPAVQDTPRPTIRYITMESYSTFVVRTYPSGSTDLDGDDRAGQEYTPNVNGDDPIQAAVLHYEADGNHKQMISFVGDNISGSIKLALGDEETEEIDLSENTLTVDYLTEKLEALTAIGENNVKVTIYPGRWLVEFIGELAGESFDPFEVDIPEAAVFEVHVRETKYNDSGQTIDLFYPIPLVGEWDADDNVVNDAVAAGSFGTADWIPGQGYVSKLNECRDYSGDGDPEL